MTVPVTVRYRPGVDALVAVDTSRMWQHLAEHETEMASEPTVTLASACLLSKWGFNDGQAPEQWLDWCEANGIDYNRLDYPLARLVRDHLVPALDQAVTVVDIGTSHNPIRAETVDGADTTEAWYGRAPEPTLTPDTVDVPMTEVLRLALEEAGLAEPPRLPPSLL
ncbi:hypothetical protein [Streptomyces sp. SID3212]|uniref:hypothetical protein n=1 Tax=Streptomyces sp. SID3212 TaxID=2690259 RepID=UPI00136AEB7C|nr:hypothetical protein [Streptomyces sp. SID3212]MYV56518.1 hypothetical protein [Streptomyces sp. SID3212]